MTNDMVQWGRRLSVAAVLVAVLGGVSGCHQLSGERGLFARRPEPQSILLRNNTGQAIYWVKISETSSDKARLASVSPLLAAQPFVVQRRPDAEPLPDRALVVWGDAGGRHEVEVGLEDVLAQASGAAGETLVIEIGAKVSAYLSLDNETVTR